MNIDPRASAGSAGASPVSEPASPSGVSRSKKDISGSGGDGDTVEFSSPLRVLQTLASNRAERIGQLTQAVRNGTYSVNARDISRALVQETLAGAAR